MLFRILKLFEIVTIKFC